MTTEINKPSDTIADRWLALLTKWRIEKTPTTVHCPVCGGTELLTLSLTHQLNNDHAGNALVGFWLEQRRYECEATIVCGCGAETKMVISQTQRGGQ